MNESGVGTKIFNPNSCRSASTSAATNVGLTIDNVLKQGNLKNASTFYKYYFKKNSELKNFQ